MKGDVLAGYSSIGGRKMEDDYCKVSSGKYFVMVVVGEGMVEICEEGFRWLR